MKVNKVAGFWKRLASRLVDVLILASFIILISYLSLHKVDGKWKFKYTWAFYIWCVSSIALILIIFIFTPLLFDGKTIGMFILRLKIIFKTKNKFHSILKRELVFSLAWILNLILIMIFVNHTLISKFASKQSNVSYTNWESARIAVITATGSVTMILQWIFAFSIMVRKNKVAIHDKISNSKTVYINKFEIIKKKKKIKSFKPFMVTNKKVQWIGEKWVI